MRSRLVGGATSVLVTALLVVGCGVDPGEDAAARATTTVASTTTTAPQDGQVEMTPPEIEEPITPMGDPSGADESPVAASADAVMIAAAIDVQQFWRDTYEEVYGEPYTDLEGGFWSYGPDTSRADLPPCEGVSSYQDVADNAFYCSGADLIAWDRDALVAPFIDQFGAFSGALIVAHEFGHAIQARTGDFDTLRPVIAELQADCFAGAWVGHVAEGESDIFMAEADELDVAVAGLLEIRDPTGSDPDAPDAHGSGFDRVSAFAEGLDSGAERCAAYGTEEPVVTEQLLDPADTTNGDLPTADLLDLLVPDLEAYYTQLFAGLDAQWTPVEGVTLVDPATDEVSCGGDTLSGSDLEFIAAYCVDENVAVLDGAGLVPALEEIGDFAVGAEVARQWSFAAQSHAGNTENTKETFLHADCLTGLYAGDLYFQERPDAEVSLSAGDLDETLISFLRFGQDDSGGTVFERSAAFRTGFLGDIDACDALLG